MVARKSGDRRWEGGLLGNLGSVYHLLGDHQASRQHYEQALDCARDIGDRHFEGNAQCNLGLLLLQQGLPDQALPHFEAALALARSLGHARLVGMVLCNLGLLNELEARHAAALELHTSAVEAAQRQGDRRAESLFRIYLGRLQARVGQLEAARDNLQRCESLVQRGDVLTWGMLLCARAELAHLSGDAGSAAQSLQQARTRYAESGADPASELGRELVRLEATLAVPANPC